MTGDCGAENGMAPRVGGGGYGPLNRGGPIPGLGGIGYLIPRIGGGPPRLGGCGRGENGGDPDSEFDGRKF